MSFEFIKQEIKDVILIKPEIFCDNRGFFEEQYKKDVFEKNGIRDYFCQDNLSYSKENVLRGLHFQAEPYSQTKLITCIQGEIEDVIVDLRKKSATYKKYLKFNLSDKNKNILYIPKGFAHGFYTLSKEAIITYKVSSLYNKNSQKGIIWNDKDLNIDWNIKKEPILSEFDKSLPNFSDID